MKCKDCKHNLIKKLMDMEKDVEYNIVLNCGEQTHGSKDFVWYMNRYGDVKGVCVYNKCMD